MYLFNENLILTKYKTPVDILLEFFDLRLDYYVKRKDYITKRLQRELEILTSKARFIKEYINGDLDINKRSKDYIVSVLEKLDYVKDEASYDYLLRLPIYSLTLEKIKELEEQCNKKESELKIILSKSPEDLWIIDLKNILKKLI
jgi:DNA topoisomerase-2